MFDLTITLGNVLTLIGFAAAAFGCIAAVRKDVAILATRLTPIENAVADLILLMEKVVRHDERLKAVERDIERNDPRQKWRQPAPR